jgi:Xaa-Pro dipeptidase
METVSLGNNYKISLQDVFAQNRQKLFNCLDDEMAVVFLKGGEAETRYDSDHEPLFRQESYFLWLTGVQEPDCAVMLSASSGCTLFIPRLPADYATIMGPIKSREEWRALFQVHRVEYMDTVNDVLLDELENGRGDGEPKLLLMEGQNSDSGKTYDAPDFSTDESLHPFVNTTTLFPLLAECRVVKSPAELDLLRHVTEITSFAHVYVMRNLKDGMFEYQCESLFRHYCYYNYACRLVAYTPICGCGPSGAVLHYGHAGEPNTRQIGETDMCLFDMGAEYFGYGSDVTCSFPASGIFTERQKGIWHGVLSAQIAVFTMLKPGVSFVDCHKAAEKAILMQLAEVGIVTPGETSFDELVEQRLGAVFMPHGLGHFIGIDTHDVGGYLPGHPERIQKPGLKSLRTARILAANMVLTVEPGCYFIDHLLDEALAEGSPLAQYLDADVLKGYRGFGGVRLEDVVTVTEDSFINYTLCPRTVEEIEHVMAGGKWPPREDRAPELGRQRLLDPSPLPAPPSL